MLLLQLSKDFEDKQIYRTRPKKCFTNQIGAKLAELVFNDQEQDAEDDLEQDVEDDLEPDVEDDLEPDAEDDQELGAEEVWTGGDRLTPIVPTPGCAVSFFADNKRHHAICLAVINDELLLEHKGASRCFLFTGKVLEIVSRLRAGVASATITVGALKACRYRSVPKKWLKEMVKTGQTWKGIESGGRLAPPPADLLNDGGQMELF
jgi:hypothetical protein